MRDKNVPVLTVDAAAGTTQEHLPVDPSGHTPNPFQTLQAAAQPHGLMGGIEETSFGITSNPIQT